MSLAKTTSTLALFVVFAAGLGLFAGCSSQPAEEVPPAVGELQQLYGLLHAAAGATGRVPTQLTDLGRYQKMYSHGYEAVKSGNIVVLWGAPLKGEEDMGKDEAVLAYEKDVPTNGGHVLLSAGTIKKMTAAEFQAALKSQP